MTPDQPLNGRVYLIDASIYVYHGWRDRPDSEVDADGQPANALNGFADVLCGLLERDRPQQLGCVFDPLDGASARRAIDPYYKRHRKPRPPALSQQFDRCRQWCERVGLAALCVGGCEADDVIAALAGEARRRTLPVTVVSADKDLAQVIRPGDELWEPLRGRRLSHGRVVRWLGVKPEQLPDMLALCGDKADNIPGVPGLGPAKAVRLLRRWGDLDTLGEHLDEVGQMRFAGAAQIAPTLRRHWDGVRAARRLTGALPVPDFDPGAADLGRRPPAPDWRETGARWGIAPAVLDRWAAVLA